MPVFPWGVFGFSDGSWLFLPGVSKAVEHVNKTIAPALVNKVGMVPLTLTLWCRLSAVKHWKMVFFNPSHGGLCVFPRTSEGAKLLLWVALGERVAENEHLARFGKGGGAKTGRCRFYAQKF